MFGRVQNPIIFYAFMLLPAKKVLAMKWISVRAFEEMWSDPLQSEEYDMKADLC